MRAPLLLCPLLLVAACTGGGGAARPSATAAASLAPGVVVAVDRGARGVELYRIGQDRKAVLESTLAPPDPRLIAEVTTLSGGGRPTACVIWTRPDLEGVGTNQLRCYDGGDASGALVPQSTTPTYEVALSTDGRRLAWLELTSEEGISELVAAALGEPKRGGPQRVTFDEDGSTYVSALAWSGDRLVVQRTTGDNDDPGEMAVVPTGPVRTTQPVKHADPGTAKGYDVFLLRSGYDSNSALALEVAACENDCHGAPSTRAVRVELTTGRVLEVVSTPLSGRSVTYVGGGPGGIVYVTFGKDGARVYLRLPGEKHGVLVTGLSLEPDTALVTSS